MKGFPRRGSDLRRHDPSGFPRRHRLNEGLPQKGKRYPFASRLQSAPPSLNEGLPQKGKRSAPPGRIPARLGSLNEGLPQKGKRCMPADMAIIDDPASMKGFPRRGSDPSASPREAAHLMPQ